MKKPHIEVALHYINNQLKHIEPLQSDSNFIDKSHLVWMLNEIISDKMSDTKANRWLGYVQGVMTCSGIIDVESERNRTRKIFDGK